MKMKEKWKRMRSVGGSNLVCSPDWGSKAFNSPSDEQASCSSLPGKKRSGFAEAAENREAGQAQAHQQGAGGFRDDIERS